MRFGRFLHYAPFSPLALLPVAGGLAAAATLGSAFGLAGGAIGLVLGIVLGLVAAFFWFHFVTAKGHDREQAFRDKMVEDLMSGKLRPSARPPRVSRAVEPIPLSGSATRTPERAPVEISTDLATALENISERASENLAEAVRAAEELTRQYPRDGRAAGLHARLKLRGGRVTAAVQGASDAIQMSLLGGHEQEAVELLGEFWAHRQELTFDAPTALALARELRRADDLPQSDWCLDRAAAVGATTAQLEKVRSGR